MYHRNQVSFMTKAGVDASTVEATVKAVPGVTEVIVISHKLGIYMADIDETRADAVLAAIAALPDVESANFPAMRGLVTPVDMGKKPT